MKRAEPDEMQVKIDALNITSSDASDKVKAEMQQMDEELEKQHTHRATSQAPSKLSDGSLWHFTIDVDWVPGSEVGLEGLLDFCDRWKFKATIFVAGRFAETYVDLIRECRRRGHELGTHGWEHGSLEHDEDFRSASYDQQRAWIRLATEAVEKASGVRPVVFRAPSLWVSETTLRALEAEGYRYDSSVPARRFDCGFGRVHYLKYFRAPRSSTASRHPTCACRDTARSSRWPPQRSCSPSIWLAPDARPAGDEVDGRAGSPDVLRGWSSIATPTNSCTRIGNPSRATCRNGICRA